MCLFIYWWYVNTKWKLVWNFMICFFVHTPTPFDCNIGLVHDNMFPIFFPFKMSRSTNSKNFVFFELLHFRSKIKLKPIQSKLTEICTLPFALNYILFTTTSNFITSISNLYCHKHFYPSIIRNFVHVFYINILS